jgi:hypothetical protein
VAGDNWRGGRTAALVTAGLALFIGGALVGGVVEHWDWGNRKIDWGTGGEWFAGILTAVLLAVTILALARQIKQTNQALSEAKRANELESARWTADQDDRLREQASRIGCYYEDLIPGLLSVRCRNDSGALIYDVQPFAIIDGLQIRGEAFSSLEAPDWRSSMPPGGYRLGGGAEVILHLDPGDRRALLSTHALVTNGYGVTFADNAGRWWRKWGNLELESDPSMATPPPIDQPGPPTTERGRMIAAQQVAPPV